MAKKSRKPSSESLVNAILEDLRHEVGPDQASDSTRQGSDDTAFVIDETRHLPEGLESEAAVYGKPKPATPAEPTIAQSFHPGSARAKTGLDFPPIPTSSYEASVTRRIPENPSISHQADLSDRTQPMVRGNQPWATPDASTKISHGFSRPLTKASSSLAASTTEIQLIQAENLKMAQNRILELEKENETLRQENELLASAGEIAKSRAEEMFQKVQAIEQAKFESVDHAQMEMNIYRENMSEKDREVARMRQEIEEFETRLSKDLKKIRVRERELENRLELSKMEKTALIRAKDEAILDLKNKVDQLDAELDTYKVRCAELGQKVDGQQNQLGRTVRALRLAPAHLESNEPSGAVSPLKKAD